jgi:hypothetical protein
MPDQEVLAAKLTSTNLLPEAALTNRREAATQNEVHLLRRTILSQNLAARHVHLQPSLRLLMAQSPGFRGVVGYHICLEHPHQSFLSFFAAVCWVASYKWDW